MSIRPTPPAPTPARRPLPSAWALGWRQWRQDLRSGELRLLLLAIMLAVGASSAVAFFADRLQAGLTRDAGALLGGDLVIASDQPLPDEFAAQARAMGLGQASNASFPSMARAAEAQGGASRLVAVKAVSEHYPLRGELEISPVGDGQPARKLRQGPPAGEVWADAAVLEALNLKPGDPLLLGDASLRLSAVLRLEPDRGAGFINFAPRVMLNAADLPATGLIQPASRVTWRLAVAAPAGAGRSGQTALQAYQAWAQDRLNTLALRGVRLETLDQGRPEMRQTLDRASQFLHLVAVLAGLLAAVAVAIAARNFAQRRLDACALLRVLGLPRRLIAQAYLVEFGLAGLLASLAGVAVGLAVQQVFAALLGSLVGTALPAPGWRPAGLGLAVGLTLLAAFGLPPLLQLAQVPPLRVLRRQLGGLRAGSASVLIGGVLGYGALLVVSADDLKLGLVTVAGFGVAWGLFAALAWLAVMVLRRAVPDVGAPRWLLLATRQLAARPGLVVLQVSALSLGLLALLLLVVLRTDLIESWRAATPPGTPDRFVINIQPDQAASFRATLDGAGVNGYDWHPMIRGRLTLVNDKPVKLEDYASDRARRLVDREFNLSHGAHAPAHNQIVAGHWTPEEADGLSVEDGLAQTLGLKLGDRLVFDVAGQALAGRITSLRKVDWASMRVNFFVLIPRAELPNLPATQIAAFQAPRNQAPGAEKLDRRLSRDYPNITLIDVSAQIEQVRQVLDQVIAAVEFLFAFTLAAGLLVLFAAMNATREGRAREFALMRAMGAGGRLLAQVQRTELLGAGTLAGTLAALVSLVIAALLARHVFEFDWHPRPWTPLAGALLGAVLAWLAGWASLREVLQRPVAATLRQATSE